MIVDWLMQFPPMNTSNVYVHVTGMMMEGLLNVSMIEMKDVPMYYPADDEAVEYQYVGWVYDNYCLASPTGIAEDGTNVSHGVHDHMVGCLLLQPCIDSGYALMKVDITGMYHPVVMFTNASTALVLEYLEPLPPMMADVQVVVSGYYTTGASNMSEFNLTSIMDYQAEEPDMVREWVQAAGLQWQGRPIDEHLCLLFMLLGLAVQPVSPLSRPYELPRLLPPLHLTSVHFICIVLFRCLPYRPCPSVNPLDSLAAASFSISTLPLSLSSSINTLCLIFYSSTALFGCFLLHRCPCLALYTLHPPAARSLAVASSLTIVATQSSRLSLQLTSCHSCLPVLLSQPREMSNK
eukprot:353755-Chlamydomonas_euryale.AAC.3